MKQNSSESTTKPEIAASELELAINEQLFASQRLPMLMIMLACLTFALQLWVLGRGESLLPLLSGLAGLLASKALIMRGYARADRALRSRRRWRNYITLTAALGGGALAFGATWLMPLVPPLQQALCIGLITAASVMSGSSNAICARVHLSFTLTSLLPLSLSLLLQGDPGLKQWGLLSLFLLLAQLLSGWQMQRIRLHSVIADLENQTLLREHQQSKRMSDVLSQELGREMFERKSMEDELRTTKWQLESHLRERQRELSASEQARRHEADSRQYLAQHDQLTGLGNRSLLMQRLEDHANHLRGQDGSGNMALLLLDIDRFKWINESLGHDLADEVLRRVAQRLNEEVGRHATLARMAVDEFAILLETAPPRKELEELAARLLYQLRQPMALAEHDLRLSASIGISLYPAHGLDEHELINHASHAVQHVKSCGGNRYAFFSEQQQGDPLERLRLEAQLEKALALGQLQVYYQPRLNLANDRVEAAEALVRWKHPELGMVSPASFISLAEETGQISAIGTYVLRQACLDAKRWLQAGQPLRLSVNVSTHQLRQGDFVEQVSAILKYTGLPADLLELELTESQLSVDLQTLATLLHRLRTLGIRLAIDDFGTGYSSLSYLRQLPVDVLKIDGSFVVNIGNGSSEAAGDEAITRAIIVMAHSLGLDVVAEGVENEGQLDFLRANHCNELQGYLFSRPVPRDDLTRLLEACTSEA